MMELPYQVRDESERAAARRQAATMVYHDCKARALAAHVFGFRYAFQQFLLMDGGKTVGELAANEISQKVPQIEFRQP